MTPGKGYDRLKMQNFGLKNAYIFNFGKFTNLNRKINENFC